MHSSFHASDSSYHLLCMTIMSNAMLLLRGQLQLISRVFLYNYMFLKIYLLLNHGSYRNGLFLMLQLRSAEEQGISGAVYRRLRIGCIHQVTADHVTIGKLFWFRPFTLTHFFCHRTPGMEAAPCWRVNW